MANSQVPLSSSFGFASLSAFLLYLFFLFHCRSVFFVSQANGSEDSKLVCTEVVRLEKGLFSSTKSPLGESQIYKNLNAIFAHRDQTLSLGKRCRITFQERPQVLCGNGGFTFTLKNNGSSIEGVHVPCIQFPAAKGVLSGGDCQIVQHSQNGSENKTKQNKMKGKDIPNVLHCKQEF